MTQVVVAQRMWQRRDTAGNWSSVNPVLAAGEIGVELGAEIKFKIGDGATPWNGLAYFSGGGGIVEIVAGDNIDVDNTDPSRPVVSAAGGGAPRVQDVPSTGSGAVTCDWSAYDEIRVVVTANVSVSLAGAADGQRCLLVLQQDVAGSRDVLLPFNVRFNDSFPSYVPSSAPGKADFLQFVRDGATGFYDLVGVVVGAQRGAAAVLSFDPTRKDSRVALSSGNARASTNIGSGHYKAFMNLPKTSGKWQFEVTVVSQSNDVGVGVTAQNNSATAATYPYTDSAGCGVFWSRQSGSLSRVYNGSSFSSPSPLVYATTGSVITVCVDFDAKTVLYKKNGVVIGSGAYPTGSLNAGANPCVPYVALWGSSGTACVVDVNSTIQYPEPGYADWAP